MLKILYVNFIFIILLAREGLTIKLPKNLILSFSEEFTIKNIILIKHNSLIIDKEIMSFAKLFAQSNIYISFISAEQAEMLFDEEFYEKSRFSKTLISTIAEEADSDIYKLIRENDIDAWRFRWLLWSGKNMSMLDKEDVYIPYNCQLLILEEGRNKVSHISEIYNPSIFSPNKFKRNFGMWSEDKGLQVFETDLYKRRLNMNMTSFRLLIKLVR